jgi:predicted dehydrogenase
VTAGGRPITRGDVVAGREGLGPLAGDDVRALYGLEGGATFSFQSKRNAGVNGARFGLQIHGTRGVLEILTGHLPSVRLLRDPAWSPGRSGATWEEVTSAGVGAPEPLVEGGLHAGNVLVVKDLLEAIEADRRPGCDAAEGRAVVEMIHAVFESARRRGPVELPLTERTHPLERLEPAN